jgi:hypothetical protein
MSPCGALEARTGDRGVLGASLRCVCPRPRVRGGQSSPATAPKTVALLKNDGEHHDGLRHGLIEKIGCYPGYPSGTAFIAHLQGRRIRVEADLVDELFNSSEKQLARPAPALLVNFGKEETELAIAKINRETLAECRSARLAAN